MRYLLERSRIQHLVKSRNGYLILAISSITLNLLMIVLMFFMVGRERIVVVPPEINRSFWLTSGKVSPEYLSEMSLYFVSLGLNVTSSNVTMQHNLLLKYVDPVYYGSLKARLVEIEDKIKKDHITTVFYPTEVKVDALRLVARITGDLQYTIGDIQVTPQRVVYQFRFSYRDGLLRITSFPEVNNNA